VGNAPPSQDGYVYDTEYYDATKGTYTYTADGNNGALSGYSLGSDADYVLQNGGYQLFGEGYYVVPETRIDDFYAVESKTGDTYWGYVYDNQRKYSAGSTYTTGGTDQDGGTWTYHVYSNGVGNAPLSNNGYVYDTEYYDADTGTYSYTYNGNNGALSGSGFLGSDADYILQNSSYQLFGEGYCVVGGPGGSSPTTTDNGAMLNLDAPSAAAASFASDGHGGITSTDPAIVAQNLLTHPHA
jgi:hypothetical protein